MFVNVIALSDKDFDWSIETIIGISYTRTNTSILSTHINTWRTT